jgi:hypothetical protein
MGVEASSAAAEIGKGGGGKMNNPLKKFRLSYIGFVFVGPFDSRHAPPPQRSRSARCCLQRHGLGKRISQSIQILVENTNNRIVRTLSTRLDMSENYWDSHLAWHHLSSVH